LIAIHPWIPASPVKYATHLTGQVAGMTKKKIPLTPFIKGVKFWIAGQARNDKLNPPYPLPAGRQAFIKGGINLPIPPLEGGQKL